jgi:plasmid maintenance system antidote protein VapI
MLPTNRPPTHPGEMLLKEFLEPLGVSQVEAARRMKRSRFSASTRSSRDGAA